MVFILILNKIILILIKII